MKKIIHALFYFLLLSLPFIFTAVNEELFEFNKMLVIYAFTIIISFFWLLGVLQQEISLNRSKLQLPLMIFFFSQLLSTIFSIHPRTSLLGYYTRLNGGLMSTICYSLLFIFFTSSFEKKDLPKIINTLLISGLLVSFYAIPEHFGHSLSCLLITHQFDVSCWVQDVQNRVFASFGQPNWLAAYLIMLIPLAIYYFEEQFAQLNKADRKKNSNPKLIFSTLLSFFSANLMFLSLLFTKSRSGLLGLALGLGIYYLLNFYRLFQLKPKNQTTSNLLTIKNLLMPTSLALLLLIFGSIYSPNLKQIWQRLTNNTPQVTDISALPKTALDSTNDQGGTESGDIRKIVWQGALAIAKRYPLFGSGVETFAYSYYQDRPLSHNLISEWDFLYNKAHNEYLNFLATTGVIGLISYLIFTLAIIYIGFKIRNKHPLSISLISGLIALYVSNFFGFSTVMVSLLMFIFAGMIAVLGLSTDHKPAKLILFNQFFKALNFIPKEISAGAWLILVLLLLNQVSKIWQADFAYTVGKQLARDGKYNQGISKLQQAIKLSPNEALFYDELASTYARIAVDFAQVKDEESSQKFEQAAIDTTNLTLMLNPRHLNFHKTKIRTLITLSALNSQYLVEAEQATLLALQLAPTDAKLMFNLGLIQLALNKSDASLASFKTAIEMKANYYEAILQLAKQYEAQNNYPLALKTYQELAQLLPKNEEVQQTINLLEASISAKKIPTI